MTRDEFERALDEVHGLADWEVRAWEKKMQKHDDEQRKSIEEMQQEVAPVACEALARLKQQDARLAQQQDEVQSWRETAKSVGEVDPHGLARHVGELSAELETVAQKDRLLRGLQALILVAILGIIYWGNGNELNTVAPPIAQVIEEHKDEIQALQRTIAEKDKTITSLKTQLKTAKYAMKQYETRLAEVRQAMPTVATVQKAVLQATRTDEGLKQETKRVLGDLGITKLRVMR